MNIPKQKWLVYIACFFWVLVIALFYIWINRDLRDNIQETKEEKKILLLMRDLDQLNTSITFIERNEKPTLMSQHLYMGNEIRKGYASGDTALQNLMQECSILSSTCRDIQELDSIMVEKKKLADSILYFSENKQPALANQLLSGSKDSILVYSFVNTYNRVYATGKNALQSIREQHNHVLQRIYTILIYIAIGFLIFILVLFRLILKQIDKREELLAQKRMFAEIVRNSPDPITVSDVHQNLIYYNKAAINLFKLDKEASLGKNIDETLGTINNDDVILKKAAAIQETGHWQGEIQRKDANGNIIYFYLSANAITDNKGNIIAYAGINSDISELKKSKTDLEKVSALLKEAKESLEIKVKEQTSLLKEVFERIKDVFLATDDQFIINYANANVDYLFNQKSEEITGKNILELILDITGPENRDTIRSSFEYQIFKRFEFFDKKKYKWIQGNCYPSPTGLSLYFKDISEIKTSSDETVKSKRLFEFISKANEMILHANSADEIFQKICGIAVSTGNFLFAWIGVEDEESKRIKAVYKAGLEAGYLEVIHQITSVNQLEGKGPTGTAFREGKYHYVNDISNDPEMILWRNEALIRGYRSSIALPVFEEDIVKAVFTLYADKPFYFSEDEISMLVRVTDNINYALNYFNNEEKKKKSEKAYLKVLQAIEQSYSSVIITDVFGNIEYVNPSFTALTGYTFEEVVGQNPRILKSGRTSAEVYIDLWNKLSNNEPWHGELCNKKKNGTFYWEAAVISPIVDEEGNIINYVGVMEDITENKQLEEEREQLLKILDHTTAYVAMADTDRNFLYANKAFRATLELGEKENLKNVPIGDFIKEGKSFTLKIYEDLKKTGTWIGENIIQSRSGKEIPVLQVIVLHKNELGIPIYTSTTMIDLSDIKHAERKMMQLNNELRDFSKHLQEISEIEKKEIAREIHDELGQTLTSLKFGVSWINKHLNDDQEVLEKKLQELLAEISEAMISFRRICSSLHPAMLEELGLYDTVNWMVKTFSKSEKLNIIWSSNLDNESVAFNISLAIYRVIQESLTNILRYAEAKEVIIELNKAGNSIELSIQDDGCGFIIEAVDTKLHHGILGMRERLYAINGQFTIQSTPGKGTLVIASVPL